MATFLSRLQALEVWQRVRPRFQDIMLLGLLSEPACPELLAPVVAKPKYAYATVVPALVQPQSQAQRQGGAEMQSLQLTCMDLLWKRFMWECLIPTPREDHHRIDDLLRKFSAPSELHATITALVCTLLRLIALSRSVFALAASASLAALLQALAHLTEWAVGLALSSRDSLTLSQRWITWWFRYFKKGAASWVHTHTSTLRTLHKFTKLSHL